MKNLLKNDKFLIGLLAFLALLPRLLFIGVPFIVNVADAAGYVELANIFLDGVDKFNLAQFVDTYIYRTPTYPIFLAIIITVFKGYSLLGFTLVQHVLGILLVILIFFLGEKIFGRGVAFFSALFMAFNPHLIYWEHNAMTEFLSTFLIILSIYILIKAVKKKTNYFFILAGFLFGLTILCRPTFQFIWLFIPFYLFLKFKKIKKTVIFSSIFIGSLLLTLSPWLLKNYFRHEFLGLSTLGGPSAMNRVESYTDFNSGIYLPEKKIYLRVIEELKPEPGNNVVFPAWFRIQKEMGYNEVEIDKIFKDIFLETVKKNPGRYLKETLIESRNLLGSRFRLNLLRDADVDQNYKSKILIGINSGEQGTIRKFNLLQKLNLFSLNYIWFFWLAIFGGLVSFFKKNWEGILLLWIMLYSIFFTVFLANGLFRYRLPIEPFLIILSLEFLFFSFPLAQKYLFKIFKDED